MFVPHARVRLAGGPESPRRRRNRPRRRRLHAQECLRMPCLAQTCVVCFLGSVVLLSGIAMSVVGNQPESFAPTPALNNSDAANSTASLAYGASYYAIKSMSYLGPVFMGCGLFVIIVAGVLYCEIMDKYVNVVPNKNAKRLPRKELFELIIKEFRKHYFRGIEVPLKRPGKVTLAPEAIKMSLFKALSVSTPALLVTPEISRRWQDAQGARMVALSRHKHHHHPRLQQLIQDDLWMKTSSLPSVRPSDASVALEDECAVFPDSLHHGSKRMSKSCTNVLSLFRRFEDHQHCSHSSGFDNPAYNPDEVKRKLLSLPISKDVLGKSLDEALISGVDPLCKTGETVDSAPDVSSNSTPLLCLPHPHQKHGLFVKNPRAALLRSHHGVAASASHQRAPVSRHGVKVTSRPASEAMSGGPSRRAAIVAQRASSASNGVQSMSVITCPAAASGGEDGISGGSSLANSGLSASDLHPMAYLDPFEGPGSSSQNAVLPGYGEFLTPDRSFQCCLQRSGGHQTPRRQSADAAFSSKQGKSSFHGGDHSASEMYPRTRAYSHGRKIHPRSDVLLLKPQFCLDREVSHGDNDPLSSVGRVLVPGTFGHDTLHTSQCATDFEATAVPTLDPPLQPRPTRSWTVTTGDIRALSGSDFPHKETGVAMSYDPLSHLQTGLLGGSGQVSTVDGATRVPSTAPPNPLFDPFRYLPGSNQEAGNPCLSRSSVENPACLPSDVTELSADVESRNTPRPPASCVDLAHLWESSSPQSATPVTSHGEFLAPPCSSMQGRENQGAPGFPQIDSQSSRSCWGRWTRSSLTGERTPESSAPTPSQSVIVHQVAVHQPPDACDVNSSQVETSGVGPCNASGGNPFLGRRRRSSVPVESRNVSWQDSLQEVERAMARSTSWDGDKDARAFEGGESSAFDSKAEACDIVSSGVAPDELSMQD